uniref:Uncharacterized protein n=1 Tax=Knipowitschia caucasica TaxID=637954 RepID=A0AAV2LLT9_KNICA
MEYLEGQSRRNNLVFEGVLESQGESWADAEAKVKKILTEKLQLPPTVELERKSWRSTLKRTLTNHCLVKSP